MPDPMTKTFDAVEMSRRLREQTGRKLAALTREQRLALRNAHDARKGPLVLTWNAGLGSEP